MQMHQNNQNPIDDIVDKCNDMDSLIKNRFDQELASIGTGSIEEWKERCQVDPIKDAARM